MRRLFAIALLAALLGACGRTSTTAPTAVPTSDTSGSTAAIQTISITGNSNVAANETAQLRATARRIDGSEADVTGLVTWSSDNTDVATVSAGTVTARGPAPRVSAEAIRALPAR